MADWRRELAAPRGRLMEFRQYDLCECGAQYGSNPDLCYQPVDHNGPHCNRYGCTWADPH